MSNLDSNSSHIYAKKSLGQNFLRSTKALREIVEAADLSATDTVIEIGPGEGVLTAELLKKAANVIAIEKDDRLIPVLKEKFAADIQSGKFNLIHSDILEIKLSDLVKAGEFKVVANIPYYITGLLLPLILSGSTQPSKAVFLVQKEVADRIAARDNKQSILSMSVKVYGTPKVIAKVPRGAFVPAPNVDSAIIEIANISKNFFKTISEDQFFATLKKGFAHKRKLLKGNLGLSDQEMTEAGLSPKARAEDITLDDWKKLTELISTK